jgi:mono/diheme cytochrome c family protein
MKHLCTLLLLFSLSIGARAQIQSATPEEKLRVAAEVHRIFEAKCADCHGSHLAKPKGKFGYVLDLGRVGKNDKYIEAGDLKESELYQMVLHNEMPGEDADVPPLTKQELETVAHWVMIGAPGELPPGVGAQVTAAPEPPRENASALPFFTRFLNWLGKFHPATTHFPVAFLLAAVMAEGFAWWLRRPEWTFVVRFLVVLGALSAIPTTVLGWMAHDYSGNKSLGAIYGFHRWLGTGTAIWAIVCAVLICMAECSEGSRERQRFRGALLLGGLLVTITGFLGGAIVAGGLDHYRF